MKYLKILITLCGVYILVIYLPTLLIKQYLSIEPFNSDALFSRLVG